jgi:glycerol uptake facilitator protein
MNSRPTLFQKSVAEAVGTFLLVFLGCGSVHAAVLMGAQSGVWQVAIVWGVAIALAIFTVDAISGAHINPAMTLAFAVWGRHPWKYVLPYFGAQFVGAFGAAAVLFGLFAGFISAKESEKGVKRGDPGSIVTAMCYGEYFPNPGGIASSPSQYDADEHQEFKKRFSHSAAFIAELLGTMILACMVFSLTDSKNPNRPQSNLAPIFIGLTVSVLISVLAPLTQAGFNPARDFGPRVFAYFAGWGAVAIPGLTEPGWLTVYIVAPFLGAVIGGGFYQTALRNSYPTEKEKP